MLCSENYTIAMSSHKQKGAKKPSQVWSKVSYLNCDRKPNKTSSYLSFIFMLTLNASLQHRPQNIQNIKSGNRVQNNLLSDITNRKRSLKHFDVRCLHSSPNYVRKCNILTCIFNSYYSRWLLNAGTEVGSNITTHAEMNTLTEWVH